IDLVLSEEEGDALDVAVDALVLVFHHAGKIELGLADADAHPCEAMPRLLVELGRVQKRLRRDASDIEAGAAEGVVLLNHGGLEPELRGADRTHIAAGAGTNDDEIVGSHAADSYMMRVSACPGRRGHCPKHSAETRSPPKGD